MQDLDISGARSARRGHAASGRRSSGAVCTTTARTERGATLRASTARASGRRSRDRPQRHRPVLILDAAAPRHQVVPLRRRDRSRTATCTTTPATACGATRSAGDFNVADQHHRAEHAQGSVLREGRSSRTASSPRRRRPDVRRAGGRSPSNVIRDNDLEDVPQAHAGVAIYSSEERPTSRTTSSAGTAAR